MQSLPDLVCRTAAISALGFCFFFCPGLCFFPSCPGVVAFLRIACICVTIKHSPSCCCRRFLRHYPPFPSLPSSLFHSHCAQHQRASAKSASVIGLIIIMSPRATGVRTGSPYSLSISLTPLDSELALSFLSSLCLCPSTVLSLSLSVFWFICVAHKDGFEYVCV